MSDQKRIVSNDLRDEYSTRKKRRVDEPEELWQKLLKTLSSRVKLDLNVPHEISTYVPNAHMLFNVLNQMDSDMTQNPTWISSNLKWNPILSRIYFGTLFYIQIFRVLESLNMNHPKNSRLLNHVLHGLSFTDLHVPGPIVPFFAALASNKYGDHEITKVTPTLPENPNAKSKNNQMLPHLYRGLLPATLILRRSYHAMFSEHEGHAKPWDFELSPRGNPDSPNKAARDANITPGLVYDIKWNQDLIDEFLKNGIKIEIPISDPTIEIKSWKKYLALDKVSWFSNLATLMRAYCKHWEGTVSLKDLSVEYGAVGLCRAVHTADYPDRIAHRNQGEIPRFPVRVETTCPLVKHEDFKLAALTQLNWVPAKNFMPKNDNVGAFGHTVKGSYWKNDSVIFVSNEVKIDDWVKGDL